MSVARVVLTFGLSGALALSPFPSNRKSAHCVPARSLSSAPLQASADGPLGGMMRQAAAGLVGLGKDTRVDLAALDDSTAPTWEELQGMLEAQQTDKERSFRDELARGVAGPHPLATIRRFEDLADGEEPRVTLFRDHAAWCPYCQKTWLTLEEKRVSYKIEKVNMSCYGSKPQSFMRMQPSGQIPLAIIDGEVYRQSNDIIFTIESQFRGGAHPSLLPVEGSAAASEDDLVNPLLRLEREFFGAWLGFLCARGGPGSGGYRLQFQNSLEKVENALGQTQGPFFLSRFSLVDVMFAPFLERAAASMAYFKGLRLRGTPEPNDQARKEWPRLNAWFDAMESRPAYRASMSDFYTHAHDLPPQLGGCGADPAARPVAEQIDGLTGDWHLPLPAGSVEPDWAWYADDEARREAAERLIANHGPVARFAARGCGKPGMPPARAPLADPNASPEESAVPAVDAMLRHVVHALLLGSENQPEAEARMAPTVDSIKTAAGPQVAEALGYLRDRVGVPRDMQLPPARQLRGHLNWAINKLRQ